jgi:hypothetical protein
MTPLLPVKWQLPTATTTVWALGLWENSLVFACLVITENKS